MVKIGGDVRYGGVGREMNVVNFENIALWIGAELLSIGGQLFSVSRSKGRLGAYVQWVLAGDGVFRLIDEGILLAADGEERSRRGDTGGEEGQDDS